MAARSVVRRATVQQFGDLPGREREHGDSGRRSGPENREQQRVSPRKKPRLQHADPLPAATVNGSGTPPVSGTFMRPGTAAVANTIMPLRPQVAPANPPVRRSPCRS